MRVVWRIARHPAAYVLAKPLFGVIRAIRPPAIVTSVEVGLAMLGVARNGYLRSILEVADIQDGARMPTNAGPL